MARRLEHTHRSRDRKITVGSDGRRQGCTGPSERSRPAIALLSSPLTDHQDAAASISRILFTYPFVPDRTTSHADDHLQKEGACNVRLHRTPPCSRLLAIGDTLAMPSERRYSVAPGSCRSATAAGGGGRKERNHKARSGKGPKSLQIGRLTNSPFSHIDFADDYTVPPHFGCSRRPQRTLHEYAINGVRGKYGLCAALPSFISGRPTESKPVTASTSRPCLPTLCAPNVSYCLLISS